MKSINKKMIKILGISILAVFALQACSMPTSTPTQSIVNAEDQLADPSADPAEPVNADTIEETQAEETAVETTPADAEEEISTGTSTMDETAAILENGLTQAEFDSLVFMREEEKLARDVYLALYDIWELPLFQNIANSEQTHTDSVANLLISFNIPDPADNSPIGVFVNEDLQSLYDELTVLGGQSLADALKVGAAIEEIDILDLEEALGFIQDPSIQRVFENLLKGSENHLRAFTATLENQTGEIYEPKYMSSESYADIINSETTKGGRGGRRP
jgi:hypothetical protein